MRLASTRALTSATEPAGNPTISRIGRVGKSACPKAAVVALIATIATAAAIRRVERNNALIPILPASRRPHLSVT